MEYNIVKYNIVKKIKVNEDGEKTETYGVEGKDEYNKVHIDDLSTNIETVKSFVLLLNKANIQLSNLKELTLSFFAN